MIPSPFPRASSHRLWRALSSVCFASLLIACNERPADLREWKVTDHDHTDNPSSGQVQVDPNASATPAVPGLEDVTIVAWQQNCTQCHGQLGRGDGPRGPMLKATNLSDPAWQAAASDEQIARVIKEGKGAMPPFKLPDGTIANLVKLVRMMNSARLGAHGGAGSGVGGSAAGGSPGSGSGGAASSVGTAGGGAPSVATSAAHSVTAHTPTASNGGTRPAPPKPVAPASVAPKAPAPPTPSAP